MSEESNVNMQNIEKLLNNLPENFMSILGGKSKNSDNESNSQSNYKNIEMLMGIKNVLDKVDNSKDDKVELLRALKPFLKSTRQDKIMQCLKAVRYGKLFNEAMTMNKSGKNKEEKGE